MRRHAWMGSVFLAVMLVAACEGSPYPQSTLHPASDFAGHIDDLYMRIFWWAVAVFVVVQAALVYVLIRYRARPDQKGMPKAVHGHTALEIGWTLAPAAILIFIAVPTIQTIFRVEGTPPVGALEVEVIGHQWWWEFRYPTYDIRSANELHLPVGRDIALTLTSADVVHSFWVPRLGGKRDVIPRRTTRLVFHPDSTGRFLGQCAEFCGKSHAHMRLVVLVQDSAAFDGWVEDQRAEPVPSESLEGAARVGAEAFLATRDPANHSCIACHAISGISFGVLGPDLSHFGSRTTIASGVLPNTEEALTRWLRNPAGVKPGSLMPDIDLADEEITALVAYLHSLQ